MPQLECFFDCSSPWSYLAFEQLLRMPPAPGLEIVWKPTLVGGVFNTVNPSVYAAREHPVAAKVTYGRKDLADWAAYVGLVIGSPPVFPVNSVKAMRGAFLALDAGALVPYARTLFEAYWRDLRDLSQDDVLREAALAAGLEPAAFFTGISGERCRSRLRATTDELIARGGFGVPTFFLDGDDMYFGNDRLALIAHKLSRRSQ